METLQWCILRLQNKYISDSSYHDFWHRLHCSLAFYAMHVLLSLPSWVFFLEWMIRRQWSVNLMRQLPLRPEHTTHFSSAQRKAAVARWFLGICQILNFEPKNYQCSGGTHFAREYGIFSGSGLLFLNIISLWPLPALLPKDTGGKSSFWRWQQTPPKNKLGFGYLLGRSLAGWAKWTEESGPTQRAQRKF